MGIDAEAPKFNREGGSGEERREVFDPSTIDPALLLALLVAREADPVFEGLEKGTEVTTRAFDVLRKEETEGSS